MMKIAHLLILIVSLQTVLAQDITIDEAKTTITFLFLDDDVDGTLSEFKYTGNLNFDDLDNSTLSGTVASETIDTDNWLRNRHLRNKYFQTDDFPLLKFKSDRISADGNEYLVEGKLIIKGISKTVRFRFTKTSNLLKGEATINTSNFDIFIHDEVERNKLTIKISLPYSN